MCNISFRSYFSSQNQKIKHTTFICSTPLPNMFITLHLINILHIQNNNNVTTCVGQFFSAIFMMVKQVWHFQDQKRGGGIYQLRGVAIWAEENPMHHQNTCKRIIPFSFTHKAKEAQTNSESNSDSGQHNEVGFLAVLPAFISTVQMSAHFSVTCFPLCGHVRWICIDAELLIRVTCKPVSGSLILMATPCTNE